MKKLLIMIAIITLVASCNSPYVTIMDERGKIITVREPQYSKHVNETDTVIIMETLRNGQIYNSIYSVYKGYTPGDIYNQHSTAFFYMAVVID